MLETVACEFTGFAGFHNRRHSRRVRLPGASFVVTIDHVITPLELLQSHLDLYLY